MRKLLILTTLLHTIIVTAQEPTTKIDDENKQVLSDCALFKKSFVAGAMANITKLPAPEFFYIPAQAEIVEKAFEAGMAAGPSAVDRAEPIYTECLRSNIARTPSMSAGIIINQIEQTVYAAAICPTTWQTKTTQAELLANGCMPSSLLFVGTPAYTGGQHYVVEKLNHTLYATVGLNGPNAIPVCEAINDYSRILAKPEIRCQVQSSEAKVTFSKAGAAIIDPPPTIEEIVAIMKAQEKARLSGQAQSDQIPPQQ